MLFGNKDYRWLIVEALIWKGFGLDTSLCFTKIIYVMARQIGIIKIKGSIGDLSFMKTQDGHLVRIKGGIDGNRLRHDPAFARTRENGSEFGLATKAGKLIRNSLQQFVQQSADNRITSRLVQLLMQIRQYDTVSVRGARSVAVGIQDPSAQALLTGFNFNLRSTMAMVLQGEPVVDISTGTVQLTDFVPVQTLHAPPGVLLMLALVLLWRIWILNWV
jgi:hypothetical protein